jgi:O-antigen/teichoic acid export membrane protein
VVRSTASFARWSVPNSLVADMYSRADIILIGVLAGNTAVGYYEAALRLTQPGAFFSTSITNPLLVKVSGLSSRDLDVLPDMENAVSYAGLLALPILFGAAAMSRELMVTVFGGDFAAAWPVLIGLAIFQVLNAYAKPFEVVTAGTDRVQLTFGVSGSILLLHLPLAVGLGYEYGLLGVVAATIAAETVRLTMYQVLSRRLFGGAVFTRPVVEQAIAAAAMGVAVAVVVGAVLVISSWPWLLVAVGLGATLYFGLLTLLSYHFRETVENVSPVTVPLTR